MRLDLGAETEDEAALGHQLEVIGRNGEIHRIAAEGHDDRRSELDAIGVLGGESQRDERIVACLGRPQSVVAGVLLSLGGQAGIEVTGTRVNTNESIDLHPASSSLLSQRRT